MVEIAVYATWAFAGLMWWHAFGNLLNIARGTSYPRSPDPNWLWRGDNPNARGFRAGVVFHGLAWPLVLAGCKRASKRRMDGHWCRFVDYPDGHYDDEYVVNIAVARIIEADLKDLRERING